MKVFTSNTVQRHKIFHFFPSRFLGWSNNSVDIKQINKRKENLILSVQEPHKNNTQMQAGS